MLCCFFCPLFCLNSLQISTFQIFGLYLRTYFIFLSFIGSFFVWKFTHQHKPPQSYLIFSIFAFLASLIWISQTAEASQKITGINSTFLGLTFLAIGNSAGDYFTNPQLARMGYGSMAVTACFASQLFNLIIGLGGTILKQTLQGQIVSLSSRKVMKIQLLAEGISSKEKINNWIAFSVVLAQLINLTVILVYARTQKFVLKQNLRSILVGFYSVFFVISVVLGFYSNSYEISAKNQKL